jgi:hypothetical protein
MKYDKEEYLKLLKQEAQKSIELMLQIMKSRGVNDYDPTAVISQQRKESEEVESQIRKSCEHLLESKKGSN